MKERLKNAPRFLSLRHRLMALMCLLSAAMLGLVWLFAAQFLEPLYNRYIYKHLLGQVNTLAAMIEASDEPISTRPYAFSEPVLNSEFWISVNDSHKLDLRNICLDIADSTLQRVNGADNLYPCLLHESTSNNPFAQFNAKKQDSAAMIAFRQAVMSEGSFSQIIGTSTRQMVVGRRVQNGDNGYYTVIFSTSLTRIDEAGAVLGQMMPMILLILLAISFLGAWWFSRWFTRPLTKLSHAARQMAEGNYSVRVDVPATDEIGLLAEDFNHMADRVATAAQLQRDLLANVSHDLRTPLTLIKGYAETVRDLTGENPEKRTDGLNVIVDETDRLASLVNSVMELSKVSSGADQPQRVEFDLTQLCEEVAQRYEAVCAQNGYTLKMEGDTSCMIMADPAMMERVLHNLLGNALHHIGEDGVFILRVLPLAGGGARVEVEDHGSGIAKDDLPFIFDRYYRSRSDAGKVGTGLGLSITKAILQGHGYHFGVNSTLGQGTIFWFETKKQ